ncbi:MAG: hypothetical protein F4112_02295 [Holophagales bacterium]|nr:hypothetical protein [Holophagales bacterium]MYD21550.1 hypothetical protein [Holophagales bacterium]MYI31782.1 hypothetical protein [Holophagales bacterium]
MIDFLIWLEETRPSTWMRESGGAFFSSLVFHSIGMAFVAGIHVVTDLRILGVAPGVPRSLMRRYLPVLWASLLVVTLSGLALLLAYPAKALTNPVFYFKLAAIAAALWIMKAVMRGVLGDSRHDPLPAPRKEKVLAAVSLVLWVSVITSGRFLAYTAKVMLASHLLY